MMSTNRKSYSNQTSTKTLSDADQHNKQIRDSVNQKSNKEKDLLNHADLVERLMIGNITFNCVFFSFLLGYTMNTRSFHIDLISVYIKKKSETLLRRTIICLRISCYRSNRKCLRIVI